MTGSQTDGRWQDRNGIESLTEREKHQVAAIIAEAGGYGPTDAWKPLAHCQCTSCIAWRWHEGYKRNQSRPTYAETLEIVRWAVMWTIGAMMVIAGGILIFGAISA